MIGKRPVVTVKTLCELGTHHISDDLSVHHNRYDDVGNLWRVEDRHTHPLQPERFTVYECDWCHMAFVRNDTRRPGHMMFDLREEYDSERRKRLGVSWLRWHRWRLARYAGVLAIIGVSVQQGWW